MGIKPSRDPRGLPGPLGHLPSCRRRPAAEPCPNTTFIGPAGARRCVAGETQGTEPRARPAGCKHGSLAGHASFLPSSSSSSCPRTPAPARRARGSQRPANGRPPRPAPLLTGSGSMAQAAAAGPAAGAQYRVMADSPCSISLPPAEAPGEGGSGPAAAQGGEQPGGAARHTARRGGARSEGRPPGGAGPPRSAVPLVGPRGAPRPRREGKGARCQAPRSVPQAEMRSEGVPAPGAEALKHGRS